MSSANRVVSLPRGTHTLAHFIERFRLSDTLSLPLDAVTRRFVVLSRREERTQAAAVLVEEMVSDGLPVVVLDTKGTWHALGRATDGKQPGLPIKVFGGSHGALELRHGAGRVVADCALALAEPVVVDLSGMPRKAAASFLEDFVDRFLDRGPRAMHLVLDEAHALFGDGNRRDGAGLLEWLGADESRRIGATLVTERPHWLLDRRIASRADALIAGRTCERSDQDAVWSWVEARTDRRTAVRVVESLASLSASEAWFCSPDWLGTCQRLTLRARATCAGWVERRLPRPPQSKASATELLRLQARLGEASAPLEPAVAMSPVRLKEAGERAVGASGWPSVDDVDREPRRGRPVARLVLARDEREALQRLQGGGRATVAQRARIILACAEGRLNSDVARELGITNQVVGLWRRRFIESRVDGLWPEGPVPSDNEGEPNRSV